MSHYASPTPGQWPCSSSLTYQHADHFGIARGRRWLFGVDGVRFHPLQGSILQRRDVESLRRKLKTGDTPTPPGGGWFARYRRSCGLGFRPIAPTLTQNRRESGFPGSVGLEPRRPPPSWPRGPPHGRNFSALAGHEQVPGWRVGRGSRRPDRRPRWGSAPPQYRRRGSRGGAPAPVSGRKAGGGSSVRQGRAQPSTRVDLVRSARLRGGLSPT